MDDKIIGHYKILEEIGSGSMGIIYKAEQLSLARMVAVKVLPEQFTNDSSFVQRFENEVRAIAALDHPNIVQIYDFGRDKQTYYYTMEFIDGTSLDKILLQRGALPTGQAIHIVARIAHALAYMHDRGIIHRDIKPSNIMIDKLGTVKLMDFGLALYAKARRVTVDGGIVGTPEYMSPEQASGEAVTPLSDIYSLGVVLYELLTGNIPFEADTPLGVIKKIQTQKPVAPHMVNPEIPPGVEEIILKMMAKDPRKRYQNCRAIIEDLKHFKSGEPISLLSSATTFSRRQLSVAVVGILLLFALAASIAYVTALPRHKTPRRFERSRYIELKERLKSKGSRKSTRHGAAVQYAGAHKPTSALKTSDVDKPPSPPVEEVDPGVRIAKLKESFDSLEKELHAVESALKGSGYSDTIVFTTGEETKCQIISENPDKVVIRTSMGTAEIPSSKVKSIICASADGEKSGLMPSGTVDPKEQISNLKETLASLEKELDNAESELPSPQFPDWIVFKTGEETECEIISETSDSVTVRTPLGEVEIPEAEIDSLDIATSEQKESDLKLRSELEEMRKQNDQLKSLIGELEAVAEETVGQKSNARRELDQINIPFSADELMSHAKSDDLHVVNLFLTAGMDVNTKDKLGKTALMYSADFGHTDIVKALLDKGADVNVKDMDGWTALMFAAARGHGNIVQLLLDKHADVNTKDDSGRTALKVATAEGYDEIAKLLKKGGAME